MIYSSVLILEGHYIAIISKHAEHLMLVFSGRATTL